MNLFDKAKELATQAVSVAQEQAGKFSEMDINVSEMADKAKVTIMSGRDTIINQAERVKAYASAPSESSWVSDITELHETKGHTAAMATMSPEMAKEFLKHRINQLFEEVSEIQEGAENGSAEEIVDGLVDLCVFAIGTLDLFDVDADKAWKAVHDANMAKIAGIKPERPNPHGLPDLIKPEGWSAPSHEGNHGKIGEMLKK